MKPKQFNYVMIGLTTFLGLAIILATYFGLKILQNQSRKLVEIKLENQVAEQQKTSLIRAKQDVVKYSDLQNEAKAIVPQEKDQAQTVREIVKIAGQTGVKLGTISFPASTLGSKPVSGSTEGGSSTAIKKAPFTQVQPVPGIKDVYMMPITIQSDPSTKTNYPSLINFLDKLEKNRRTAQVSSVTVQPDQNDASQLTFNLVVNAYIKP